MMYDEKIQGFASVITQEHRPPLKILRWISSDTGNSCFSSGSKGVLVVTNFNVRELLILRQ